MHCESHQCLQPVAIRACTHGLWAVGLWGVAYPAVRVCACAPQLVRGMEKTVQHLVKELAKMSVPIRTDKDLDNVASVSAGTRGGGWARRAPA